MARKADLEAAIIESPDAAAPYVVYADWLQAQGDPRGELIGVQLALETARGPEWARLKHREATILGDCAEHLLGPAAEHANDFDWRRGFVDRMRGSATWLRAGTRHDHDDEMLAHPSLALVRALADVGFRPGRGIASPLLRELGAERAPGAVLGHPQLRHLALTGAPRVLALPARSGLEIFAFDGDAELLHELTAVAFPDLRVVQAAWAGAGADLVEATAAFIASTRAELELILSTPRHAPPDLAALRELGPRVRGLRLHDEDGSGLAGLETRNLRWLAVTGVETWTPSAIAALPGGLGHLVLDDLLGDPATVAALAGAPQLQSVEALTIELANPEAGLALRRGQLSGVRTLDVRWDARGEDGDDLRATPAWLAGWSDALPRLTALVINAADLGAIAASPLAARLETLTLRVFTPQLGLGRLLPQLHRFEALRTLRILGYPALDAADLAALGSLDFAIELAPRVPPVVETLDEPRSI